MAANLQHLTVLDVYEPKKCNMLLHGYSSCDSAVMAYGVCMRQIVDWFRKVFCNNNTQIS